MSIQRMVSTVFVASFCVFSAASVARAGTIAAPPLGTNPANTPYVAVVPHGLKVGLTKSMTVDHSKMAVITTVSTATDPNPWIIVARQVHQTWVPVYVTQTDAAWKATNIVLGPILHHQQSVAVSFMVDGATGIVSNIATLSISPNRATTVATLPLVFEALQPIPNAKGFVVKGFNLQVQEVATSTDAWTMVSTPVRLLLPKTTLQLPFVLGTAGPGPKATGHVYTLGPSTLQAKVGQSISFVPENTPATTHLLGSYDNLGQWSGISVYAAVPGSGALQFFQAAQVLSETYTFSAPGRYTFGIVPPNFTGMKPNGQCAVVTVEVSK